MSDGPAVTLVGEDALWCQLGTRLLAHALPAWRIAPAPIDKGGITRLVPDLARYARAARHGAPVLCVADSDRECPVTLIERWLASTERHERMVLRLAVTEAESWVLADHVGMHEHFKTPLQRLPDAPDELNDPKALLLRLLHRHAPAALRREMVAADRAGQPRRASGYAAHLSDFAARVWQPGRAATRSPSLRRALARLGAWQGLTATRPT